MKPRKKSKELHARANRVIPGGVDSPVRAFKSVGGVPPYIVRGKGSRIWDADGNEYTDKPPATVPHTIEAFTFT